MANFLFIYRMPAQTGVQLSPEEMQRSMQKWQTWISEGMKQGWMINPGDALQKEGSVVRSQTVITDGPFVEAKEIVGGFSIVVADNLSGAAQLAKGCPGLQSGGSVEVRPLAGYKIEATH
jgi:hypothetical protein